MLGLGGIRALNVLRGRDVDGVFVFVLSHFPLVDLRVVAKFPGHPRDIILVYFLQEDGSVGFRGIRLAEEVGHHGRDTGLQRRLVVGVDSLEEVAERSRYHHFLLGLHGLDLELLNGGVGLVYVLAVGVLVEVSLKLVHGVGIGREGPVDGVDLMLRLGLVLRVGVLGEIVEQCLFRSAHHGVGPVGVDLLERVEMGLDRVDVCLGSVLIVVEISLQHEGVVALHGILVGFLFLGCLGIVVEIEANPAEYDGENDSGDERVVVLLLGLWWNGWGRGSPSAAACVGLWLLSCGLLRG